jgi:hypothetical protein
MKVAPSGAVTVLMLCCSTFLFSPGRAEPSAGEKIWPINLQRLARVVPGITKARVKSLLGEPWRTLLLAVVGMASRAPAQGPAVAYPPYGSSIPVITNTERKSGAVNEDLKKEPAPNPPNQESIWNMKVEGFNDNQARPIYQPLIVNQDGREIMYNGNLAGTAMNSLTGVSESNGTSIIDVTNVKHPKFLFHIPGPAPIAGSFAAAGAQMVRVCPGSTLPNATARARVRKSRQAMPRWL